MLVNMYSSSEKVQPHLKSRASGRISLTAATAKHLGDIFIYCVTGSFIFLSF